MANDVTKDQEHTRCFVASPSRPPDLLIGLAEAIASANNKGELQYHLWTKNDIAGRDLVQPIQENISNSPLFVADVTYLNLNVTYEVGYAIGQSKRVLLSRYCGMKGDVDLSNDIGIFDTLGRHEYDTFEQLGAFLASEHDLKPMSSAYTLDPARRCSFLISRVHPISFVRSFLLLSENFVYTAVSRMKRACGSLHQSPSKRCRAPVGSSSLTWQTNTTGRLFTTTVQCSSPAWHTGWSVRS